MVRSLKVATPAIAATNVVPPRWAPSTVGSLPMAIDTLPPVAVIVFVPATVELKVPIMCPSASVVPDGVRVLPVPVAESVTVAPLTAFPKASLTVTVIVETLSPVLAVIGLGALTEIDWSLARPASPWP